MDSFENARGKSIVLEMIYAIQRNKEFLSEVDGMIGDGDHGVNMNKGFTLCQTRMEGRELSFTEALNELGDVLFGEIGGSMGPIYGTVFSAMAQAGGDRIDSGVFSRMLSQAVSELEDVVEARVGDKTLMDVLAPASRAFVGAAEGGAGFSKSLEAFCLASEAGKDATKDMVAMFGRSSRLGERSRGILDAGAVSCNLLLQAMAGGIRSLLGEKKT
jgi:dihydroxyacetone kinase-like protein